MRFPEVMATVVLVAVLARCGGERVGGGGTEAGTVDAAVVCGDGLRQGDEACDGADLAGASCESLGYDVGHLRCAADCTLDRSGCSDCGNDLCELDESHAVCPEDCPAVIQLAATSQRTLALLEDGTVWRWPSALDTTHRPVKLDLEWPVRSISIGMCNTCVVAEDRTGWCWGDGTAGQLGDGLWQSSTSPVQVAGLSNIETIDVGE